MRRLLTLALTLVALSGSVSEPKAAIGYLIDHFEGGAALVADDAGKGLTRFGINQAAHPHTDIAHLTRAEAVRIYRHEYWDALDIGGLPPAIRFLVFDCAVNAGVARTRRWLAQAHGDAAALVRLRVAWHRRLIAADPVRFGPYAAAWWLRDFVAAATASIPIEMASR